MSDSASEDEIEQKFDEEGMPAEGPYGGPDGGSNPGVIYPIMFLVLNALGVLCAWGIYALSPAPYDKQIIILKSMDLGYLYIAVRVLCLVLNFQQVFVAVNRKKAKADNPDQYIYKTTLRDDPVVRLIAKGPIGAFNRSQRAIDNTREVFAGLLADVLLGGFVFPKPMLVCVCIYFCARMAFSAGYVKSAAGRGPGQGISFLTATVIGGMMLFAGIKSLF